MIETRELSTSQRFLTAHGWKVIALLFLIVAYETPLLGYLWRVGVSVQRNGISQATATSIKGHTKWYARYFTGPMSDDEMIAFFSAHRGEMDRLAHIVATEGYCQDLLRNNPNHECGLIEQRLGISASPWGPIFVNSEFHSVKSRECGHSCMGQSFDFTQNEPQQWRGSTHPNIDAWQKHFAYVPPLVDASRFGFNPDQFPSDPVEAVAKSAYIKPSLDVIPAELENQPEGYRSYAVRHLGNGWFIQLFPVVASHKL